MSVAIVAFGAVSGLGEGPAAITAGEPGAPPRVAIARDEALLARGLARPFASRAALRDRSVSATANVLLERALAQCAASLDEVAVDWRKLRVGLALGTSSGRMLSAETVLASLAEGTPLDRSAAEDATYFSALRHAVATMNLRFAPATLVLTACAASTAAIGVATRWLEQGACDIALAGGFDEVSTFVASGFEVLRATTASVPPRPFAKERDGMSLGEGAGVMALMPAAAAPRALAYVSGFGASADAVHLTAPDRTGNGLARAAERALADADVAGGRIELVSNHATATPFNDAAEASAIRRALGVGSSPVLFAYKAQIGHTLGAAGVLETLACVDAIARRVVPATPISGELEPALPGKVLALAEARPIEHALKLSAAFGGANAALVISARAARSSLRSTREVYVSRATHVASIPSAIDLGARLGTPAEKLARTDGLVRACLAACAELVSMVGPLDRDTGVVVGHALATLETNVSFATRLRERGARAVEPRKFPYTSPNAAAGECGAAFGFTGPGLAVGAGLHGALEALAVAVDLVRAGDAERIVVIGVDEIGDAARAWLRATLGSSDALVDGAVALVVSASPVSSVSPASPVARVVAAETAFELPSLPCGAGEGPFGHRALVPLVSGIPARLAATCPWGGRAAIAFEPVKI